jgi:hypothetical protein
MMHSAPGSRMDMRGAHEGARSRGKLFKRAVVIHAAAGHWLDTEQ